MKIPNVKRQLVSTAQKPFTTYLVLSLVCHLLLIACLAMSTQWLHRPRRYKPVAHTVSLIDAPTTLQQTSPAKPGKTVAQKPNSDNTRPAPQPPKTDSQSKTQKPIRTPTKRTVPPTRNTQATETQKPARRTASRSARSAKPKAPAKPAVSTPKPQRTARPAAPTAKTKRPKKSTSASSSRTPAATGERDQAQQRAAERRLTALRSRYGKYGESTTGSETTENLQHVRLRAYQELVREQIVEAWVLPLRQDTVRNMQATALLTIDRAGHITQLEILETSNNPLFDASLIRAIRQAAPLPALPEDYRGAYLELELHFKPDAA